MISGIYMLLGKKERGGEERKRKRGRGRGEGVGFLNFWHSFLRGRDKIRDRGFFFFFFFFCSLT